MSRATPPTLDYRRQVPTPASPVRFGCAMTLLVAVHAFLGAVMILSILFVDRLGGGVTALMAAAGAAMVYTSMGCLSRDVPRFKVALALAAFACVTAAIALLMSLSMARQLEAQILSGAAPGAVVTVYIESERGGRLATLLLAWKLCAVAAMSNLLLTAYLPFRLAILRRARAAAAPLLEGDSGGRAPR